MPAVMTRCLQGFTKLIGHHEEYRLVDRLICLARSIEEVELTKDVKELKPVFGSLVFNKKFDCFTRTTEINSIVQQRILFYKQPK